MARTHVLLAAGAALLAALGVQPGTAAQGPTVTVAGLSPASESPKPIEDFPREAFHDPTRIDNPYLPLRPGTRLVLAGRTGIGKDRTSHLIIDTVTDLTKVVDGVKSIVVHEQDITDGQLVEAEIIFYAQDDAGTVWLMGEYPEEYVRGAIVATPTWMAGMRGAAAGILMPATPTFDSPSYSEGWGPEVDWTDRARVFETGSITCVRQGCFRDVLVTDEYNADTPDSHQLKYYARGIGNVRVGWAGARDDSHESLRLARLVTLDESQLARTRAAAVAMDARAHDHVPDVYGQSAPLERQR